MKRLIITLQFCLLGIGLNAQCYDKLLQKGQNQFNLGNYAEAITKWQAALDDCPDLSYSDKQNLTKLIAKANAKLDAPTTTIRSSDFVDMVFVQGSSFNMGSNEGEADEKPVHSVSLSDFYIGKYEVTQKQWRSIMVTSPSYFKDCDNCPVEQVSWNDIQEFLTKLNQQYQGKHYRLPTEAEWEFAARGGNKSNGYTYSGSNELNDVAWYTSNSGRNTHDVGGLHANELGIYDMSGNVWEWCSDWYDADYYKNSSSSNPKGASSGSGRVGRGGGWGGGAAGCRAAYRGSGAPTNRYYGLGFRVAAPLQ